MGKQLSRAVSSEGWPTVKLPLLPHLYCISAAQYEIIPGASKFHEKFQNLKTKPAEKHITWDLLCDAVTNAHQGAQLRFPLQFFMA